MKNTAAFLLFSIATLSTCWADKGKTTVDLELHKSTLSFSPAGAIRSSSATAVTAEPDNSEKLARLTLQLRAPATRSRLQAISELGTMGPSAKADLPPLGELLTDRYAGLDAARAIHKIDPSHSVPTVTLGRLVHRAKAPPEREKVRTGFITRCESQAQALDVLAALGPAAHSVIPELVKLSHRLCVHEHVVAALSQIGSPDPAQLKEIASGLRDKDAEARQAAVEYLAKSGPGEETIRTLGKAMNDPNSGVRLSALQALEEVHPEGEGRLPLLAAFFRDPSPDIRERVVYMVGQLGQDARAAIPLLEQALKDPEPAIALTSAKLLAKINPQDDRLITTLIGFMRNQGSAQAMQSAQLLQSLNIHEARVDSALEPFRAQQALWQRISKASNTAPEQLAENARTLKVENLRIATSIVQDQPVNVARHFPADVGRVYCWTEVSVSSFPASITHRWYRNGRLQKDEYLEVNAAQVKVWSSANARQGQWKVDVLPAGGNEPIATAVFTVGKKKP